MYLVIEINNKQIIITVQSVFYSSAFHSTENEKEMSNVLFSLYLKTVILQKLSGFFCLFHLLLLFLSFCLRNPVFKYIFLNQ